MAYKIIMKYSDGTEEEQDEIFEDEDSAIDYAGYLVGCYHEGAFTLHMSNPGDYDYDEDEDVSYEIVEV